MISAGDLKHLITFKQPVSTRGSVGGFSMEFTDIFDAWAKIEPLSTREQMLAAQSQSSVTHRITVRYADELDGIDGSWIAVLGNRVFSIDGPPRNLGESNEWYEFVATEGLKQI